MDKQSISRRSFLAHSAKTVVAFGFPFFVSARALGKETMTAPSNRLTMAQIGCGGMGGVNLQSFLNLRKEVQVVAVCDVDEVHAREKKELVDAAYGNTDCRMYRDFRTMLENESLDIVSHALPYHWHALVTLACARKGIDVYGEKPLARTIGEGRAMCDAISRYGIVWQTGSWQRSVAHFRRAAELIRNGRIGKVDHVEVGLPDGEGPVTPKPAVVPCPRTLDYELWLGSALWRPYQHFHPPRETHPSRMGVHYYWRHISDFSGGKLVDWGGHHIDIAHWGLGLDYGGPREVEGKGVYPTAGIYNVPYLYDFTCTYEKGLTLRVANQSALRHGQGICWYGRDGWLFVNRNGIRASSQNFLREAVCPDEIHLYRSDNHYQNFIDCVRTRSETVAPAPVAHRSISVALLGEIAMRTGRKLHWNPQGECFVDNRAADRFLMRAYRSPWRLQV